jgi:rhodanese-related sulfurtransferase
MVKSRPTIWRGWVDAGPSLLFALALAWALPLSAADGDMVSAEEAWRRAEAGDLVIVDIRTQAEWRKTGIPQGARRASFVYAYGLPNFDFVGEVRGALGDDPTRTVALICAAGVRSSVARVLLEAEGFEHVLDIGEGMLGSGNGPGWLARGLPVEDCGDCAAP